ncbi:sulfite reductase subunit A [hot springs metagenome]|uniref:Sulfite reductase subunit A n=1 Tax=hot springs metagenome TaxID=433727 RepID=A0A5J4KTC5_9ZZZZ
MIRVKIKKEQLKLIFNRLKTSHKIIGPKINNDVIVLTEIADFYDIPFGYREQQGKGTYRLTKGSSQFFSFSVGPDSFKRFVNPPAREIFAFKKSKKRISIMSTNKSSAMSNEKSDSSQLAMVRVVQHSSSLPFLFVGMRACDIAALRLLDKVFLEGHVKDTFYDSIRRSSLIIGVNCLYPGDNCFCSSINTGPEIKDGFDMAITELDKSFLLEIGTPSVREMIDELPVENASNEDIAEKDSLIANCKKNMKKTIDISELPWLIYKSLEHPRWTDIANRCLACGNCTQVCPTCFCNSSYDYLQLSGISKKIPELSGTRIRSWDSCFSTNFARVHGGNFRPSRRARYRQWMSHKLSYWIEQFGSLGCVGCGRCITWCPVGIDITQELEALKK